MAETSFAEAVENSIHAIVERIHTCIPGRIVSYDGHAKRTAVVQPVVRLPTPTGPLLDIPGIFSVPVVFPSTAAGSLVFPLVKGDGVLICFSEVGMGAFLSSQTGDVSDPGSNHHHALTDAIAIPGLWSLPAVPTLPSLDDSAVALVSAKGAITELGKTLGFRNASSDLKTEMQKLWSELEKIRTDMASHFTKLGAACTLPPMLPLGTAFGTEAGLETSASAALETSKTGVGKLLT